MRILKHLIVLNFIAGNLLSQTKLNDSSLGRWGIENSELLKEQPSFECLHEEAFHIIVNTKEILLVNSKSNKVVEKIKLSITPTGHSYPLEKERLHWVKFKTPISPNLIACSNKIETPLHYFIPIYANDRISAYMVILFNTNNNSMSACN